MTSIRPLGVIEAEQKRGRRLEQVLADARGDCAVLRRHGQAHTADAIEALCEEVQVAAAPLLDWLSEPEAQLQSGHAATWFRARFSAWESQGLARWNPNSKRERQYLALVVPKRLRAPQVRADAQDAARSA